MISNFHTSLEREREQANRKWTRDYRRERESKFESGKLVGILSIESKLEELNNHLIRI